MSSVGLSTRNGDTEGWAGQKLRATLLFLSVPAALGLAVILFHLQLPRGLLYAVGGIIAMAVAIRSVRDPEWLIACVLLYLPISRVFVVPITTGVNGTNLLLLATIVAWWLQARRHSLPMFPPLPGRRLVGAYAVLTSISVIPAILTLGGDVFLEYSLEKYKSWIEQMLLYFAILGLIRDGAMARRVVVYAMISTLVSVLFGTQEMLDKSGASSIEKSRVFGPQAQPNEFGGFIVTSICPFITLALMYFPRARSWMLAGPVALAIKVLIATFSRGALLGMAASALSIGYLKGKKFLLGTIAAGLLVVVIVPQVLPESIAERFGETTSDSSSGEQLDKSSADRIILWQAGLQMIAESPILGKGFGMFRFLKEEYTAVHVPVSDTHNMYLFIATQMGLPALILFVAICAHMALCGYRIYRHHEDRFARAIGMAIAAMVAGWMVINMFGSRMESIETCALFWVYMAIGAHLQSEFRATKERSR